jgi:hypothetical protein
LPKAQKEILMGRLEVQGIVSFETGLPLVQFRQLDDEGNMESGWQSAPHEAREMAQQILEAAMNAIYDAAIVTWAHELAPTKEEGDEIAGKMLILIRQHRADIWGLPDQPEDWRNG